jgi:hypothetical protein
MDALGHLHGPAAWIDITESDGKIGIRTGGGDKKNRADTALHLQRRIQHIGGKDQNVTSFFRGFADIPGTVLGG